MRPDEIKGFCIGVKRTTRNANVEGDGFYKEETEKVLTEKE